MAHQVSQQRHAVDMQACPDECSALTTCSAKHPSTLTMDELACRRWSARSHCQLLKPVATIVIERTEPIVSSICAPKMMLASGSALRAHVVPTVKPISPAQSPDHPGRWRHAARGESGEGGATFHRWPRPPR